MKQFFIIMLLLSCTASKAQDLVVMRDSTRMNVKVVESKDKAIIFTFPNEDIRNEKSKKLIAYIIYASGRREECKSAVVIPTISGKDDWEKVVITRDKEDVEGLKQVKFLSVDAGSAFTTKEGARETAIEKIKKKAAKISCGIVLLTEEKFTGTYNAIRISGEAYK